MEQQANFLIFLSNHIHRKSISGTNRSKFTQVNIFQSFAEILFFVYNNKLLFKIKTTYIREYCDKNVTTFIREKKIQIFKYVTLNQKQKNN